MKWGDDNRRYQGAVEQHPSASAALGAPPVLIISHDEVTCRELERAMPPSVGARSVASAGESEGLWTRVVLIGGPSPLAELEEVRAHPTLFDKPVVLFAPMQELPEMDWQEMNVWPVVGGHNSLGLLVARVRQLLGVAHGPTEVGAEVIRLPDRPTS